MKRKSQKIILILIMLLTILTVNVFQKVYASSEEAAELVAVLDAYKDQLGDLEQFKNVIDQVYNDLNSATKVDDNLKRKLIEDINKLSEVEGINPLILQVLVEELTTQANNLTDDTLPEMQEEIRIIKEWADEQVETTGGENPPVEETPPEEETPPPTTPKPTTPSKPTDTSTSDKKIPYAGIRDVFTILIVVVAIIAIIVKKKYKNLKGI